MGSLQWGMRQWSELENQMTSVERVLEYTKLESEPERVPANPVPVDWPKEGQVKFENVQLRYSESEPYVLKSLNFCVEPKEKIGIVGRTGAGKSSTISALFQLYDIEGSIIIDGLDSTLLPLDVVRSKISIIPQEPVLFSGKLVLIDKRLPVSLINLMEYFQEPCAKIWTPSKNIATTSYGKL